MANLAVSDHSPDVNKRYNHSGIHLARAEPRDNIAGPSPKGSALIMALDVTVILAAGIASVILCSIVSGGIPRLHTLVFKSIPHPIHLTIIPGFIFAFFIVARDSGVYRAIAAPDDRRELGLILRTVLSAGLLLCGALYIVRWDDIPRLLLLVFVITAASFISLSHALVRRSPLQVDAWGMSCCNILIVGTGHLSKAIGDHLLQCRQLGYKVHGFSSLSPVLAGDGVFPDRVLAQLDDIRDLVKRRFIDEIVITEECGPHQIANLVQLARELNITLRIVSCFHRDITAEAAIEYLGIYPVKSLHCRRVRVVSDALKRIIDIFVACIMLIAAAPLMCAVAIAIKIETSGPIFYISERIGKRGRAFRCFKFRSMVQNADQLKRELTKCNERDGILFKLKNDPRVTRVGALLRKYSLDELPQLINVLRGEMSIVGPRPPIASEVEQYEIEHFRRLEVLPGLTGLWQTQARHDPSFARYIALDMKYVETWSLWLDIKIMLRTAEALLRGTGC